MFNTGGKHFPQLRAFLTEAVSKNQNRVARTEATGVLLAAGIAWFLALTPIAYLTARTSWFVFVDPLVCILAALSCGFFFRKWLARKKRPKSDQQRVHEAAMKIGQAMIHSKRLHKELDVSAGQLLDESARYWQEIRAELKAPAWNEPSLASHWQNLREQTLAAADQAMEEELVLLESSFNPSQGSRGWETVFEEVIETFVTGAKPYSSGHLPVGFQQAREVAEKLKLTAASVRNASGDLVQERMPSPARRAGAALDIALNDMRTLTEAENELRQDLRG